MENSASEQLITAVVGFISELTPINVEKTKNRLSGIIKDFHIARVESDEVHPDLNEKIMMFLSAKRLEGLSPRTLESYLLELTRFADAVKKKTTEINTNDIRHFLSSQSHLKMSTITKKLSTLKSFFGWLTGEELIPRDPTAKLKRPKQEKRMPKALTIEELEMLREACVTVRERAFLEVMYATGCRLAEVQGLDKDDIDQVKMSCLVIGKGNKQREVYFSFKAMFHLKKYLQSREDDCEALFVTVRKPYRRLSPRGIADEIDRIADRAGLGEKVTPHVMRHTFATLTLNNGAELTAVQELLGHESPETTLRYARITEERKKEQHKKFLIQ